MGRTPAGRLSLAALAVALAAPGAWSDEGTPERVIRYERDTLTVHVTNVPVTDVLDALGQQAGAQIRGQVREPRQLSVEFEAVPLADALHRLLGDQNFALVYGNQGRLKSVRLLGGPQTAAAGPAPPTTQPRVPTSVMDAFAKFPRIPVTGQLSQAVGSSEASLIQLADLGVHHADATVRAQAAGMVVGAIEADPNLRAIVLEQLGSIEDGRLSDMLRNVAGDHAEEVATLLLSNARTAEMRARASALLQRLRAGG